LAEARLRDTSQSYFVTDSWKALPNLTVEAGLRYEYIPPWSSKGDNIANIIVPDFVVNPTPGITQPYIARNCAAYGQNTFYIPELPLVRLATAMNPTCTSAFGTSTLVRDDKVNFAPRLGIAWSPTTKWTVRAGAGVFFVQDRTNSYFDMARNIAGRSTDTVNPLTNNLTWQHPFNINPGPSVCGVQSPPFICVTTPLGLAIDPDRRTPYMYQFTMNVQRQLTASTALEAGYMAVLGHRLQGQTLLGQAVPGPGPTGPRTPYPAFSTVDAVIGAGHSNYHAFSLKLTRRLSNGLSLLAGYTFSKSLDTGSGITPENGFAPNQPQTGWCRRCEYGYSDFDTRNRVVMSALYELPVVKGNVS
jgi:hypothetical protein